MTMIKNVLFTVWVSILLAFCAAALVWAFAGHLYSTGDEAQLKELKPASVIMVNYNKPVGTPEVVVYPTGTCSATHIGNGLFVTAAHCYNSTRPSYFADYKLQIEENPEDFEVSELLWHNTKYDVALYLDRKAGEGRASAELDCREPLANEEITHIGFPNGTYFQSWGKVSTTAVKRGNYWAKAQLVNLTGAPGSSGGSIFDNDGHLVGILNGGPSPWGGAALIVPGSVICGLMGKTPEAL